MLKTKICKECKASFVPKAQEIYCRFCLDELNKRAKEYANKKRKISQKLQKMWKGF